MHAANVEAQVLAGRRDASAVGDVPAHIFHCDLLDCGREIADFWPVLVLLVCDGLARWWVVRAV